MATADASTGVNGAGVPVGVGAGCAVVARAGEGCGSGARPRGAPTVVADVATGPSEAVAGGWSWVVAMASPIATIVALPMKRSAPTVVPFLGGLVHPSGCVQPTLRKGWEFLVVRPRRGALLPIRGITARIPAR